MNDRERAQNGPLRRLPRRLDTDGTQLERRLTLELFRCDECAELKPFPLLR
jgi:hypothetical protein